MENVIIIAIIAVIAVFAVKSCIRRANQGCCGTGGDSEKKVRVRDKNKENYPYCVRIGVEGMTCNHCKERVENALNKEDGVWAQVNLAEKSALVRMKKELSREDLERVIRRAGYTMTDFEQMDSATAS